MSSPSARSVLPVSKPRSTRRSSSSHTRSSGASLSVTEPRSSRPSVVSSDTSSRSSVRSHTSDSRSSSSDGLPTLKRLSLGNLLGVSRHLAREDLHRSLELLAHRRLVSRVVAGRTMSSASGGVRSGGVRSSSRVSPVVKSSSRRVVSGSGGGRGRSRVVASHTRRSDSGSSRLMSGRDERVVGRRAASRSRRVVDTVSGSRRVRLVVSSSMLERSGSSLVERVVLVVARKGLSRVGSLAREMALGRVVAVGASGSVRAVDVGGSVASRVGVRSRSAVSGRRVVRGGGRGIGVSRSSLVGGGSRLLEREALCASRAGDGRVVRRVVAGVVAREDGLVAVRSGGVGRECGRSVGVARRVVLVVLVVAADGGDAGTLGEVTLAGLVLALVLVVRLVLVAGPRVRKMHS